MKITVFYDRESGGYKISTTVGSIVVTRTLSVTPGEPGVTTYEQLLKDLSYLKDTADKLALVIK